MVVGLGTDLVEIIRFEKSFDFNSLLPFSNKLLDRVLTLSEREIFDQRWAANPQRAISYLATRFAAKEAFAKAMGCGIGQVFSFQDLSVLNSSDGQPVMEYSTGLQAWLDERSLVALVSLSDEQHYAVATVILSKIN